ncbi:MAG: hypothetical protein MHM6MM_009229 [Cercozoa sp. M6MM]
MQNLLGFARAARADLRRVIQNPAANDAYKKAVRALQIIRAPSIEAACHREADDDTKQAIWLEVIFFLASPDHVATEDLQSEGLLFELNAALARNHNRLSAATAQHDKLECIRNRKKLLTAAAPVWRRFADQLTEQLSDQPTDCESMRSTVLGMLDFLNICRTLPWNDFDSQGRDGPRVNDVNAVLALLNLVHIKRSQALRRPDDELLQLIWQQTQRGIFR